MSVSLHGMCIVLMLGQFLAAAPWMAAVGLAPRGSLRSRNFWLYGLAAAALLGEGLALYLDSHNDPKNLVNWGRFYFSILHLQLGLDLFVFIFLLLLWLWPKGGAVALAAFQEGVRQPKYWLLLVVGFGIMATSTIMPFFTFGEDIKVVKELCYTFTMIMPGVFGVLAASISVSEEIEGRTAVTLMSKPIMRRDFLLGKFVGIALACLTMTVVLGWWMIWVALGKDYIDPPIVPVETPDPLWTTRLLAWLGPGNASNIVRGMCLWMNDAIEALPGLAIGFCQVMVITAFATALATRVSMAVNIVACMVIYFLGHLTTVLTDVTARANPLVRFLARLFDTILPSLDHFDVGSAIIRDNPLPPMEYAVYALHVTLYGLTFTVIALLIGLILFEDRDLA